MVINTILIILHNIKNYLYILCSNKKYTITALDALSRLKDEKKFTNKNPIFYKSSNIVLFCLILLQNFVLFFTIEYYFSHSYKQYYKIITSVILFFFFNFNMQSIL